MNPASPVVSGATGVIRGEIEQKTANSSAGAKTAESPKYGHIIVLTGIVAAGKSSIVKALQKVDPSFHEEDLDLRRDPEKPTPPGLEQKMIDDAIDRSLKGGKTIISLFKNTLLADRIRERTLSGIPVQTVLAHCPFDEITVRLEARNKAAEAPGGDPKNYRDNVAPLQQFASLYTQDAAGRETITRAKAIEYFNRSFDQIVIHAKKDPAFTDTEEQIAKDKAESCKEFLIKLGFTHDSVVEIQVKPKAHYDEVIDTSKYRDESTREKLVRELLGKLAKS